MIIVFWNQSHLWRDRKELSEINLLDMWFCSFFITYQRKQARQSRIAVVPVSEKSWSKTDRPVFLTFEKPLCKDIHGPGPVHTHHLPQGVAPARVRCPAGVRQTFFFFRLKAPVVFFLHWCFHAHQATVASPEPKSRREWGANDGSLFLICDDQKKKEALRTGNPAIWCIRKTTTCADQSHNLI